jgi:DNA repair protein RecO (recombination protein O)
LKSFTTEGILLQKINYAESSQIVSFLTKNYGLQKFFLRGIKKSKTKKKYNFHHLSISEISGKEIKNEGIQNLSEIKPNYSLVNIVSHFDRISISFFISEVLMNVLSIGDSHPKLYAFIKKSILELNDLETETKLFPHNFLIELSDYLGFGLQHYQHTADVRKKSMSWDDQFPIQELDTLQLYLGTNFDGKSIDRTTLLNEILKFYNKQIDTFGQMKSLDVLREIMS